MSDSQSPQPFDSLLPTGRERFLAQVMVHALQDGWATPEDFLRHFPPQRLIESLAEVNELRVSLLVRAAKVHEKIAAKKSLESAAEDLTIAVSEGICTPAEVLEVYGPDDRVTFLDGTELWAFASEGEWSSLGNKERDYPRALARMVFVVERALAQNLITLPELFDALTFDQIATLLPEQRLQDVVRHALVTGRENKALDERSLLNVVPLAELLSVFELAEIWNRIVAGAIAKPNDLLGTADGDETSGEEGSRPGGKAKPPAARRADSPKPTAAKPAVAPAKPAPAPKPAPATPQRPAQPSPAAGASRPPAAAKPAPLPAAPAKAMSAPPPPPPGGGDSDEARAAVVARLTQINRLPPSHAHLSLAMLLSIDTMYADLDMAESDDEREDSIREAFPNQVQLRQAMLALIELLDPTINTKDPLIRDAEVDSLIKIVMFEERRRH
ncbi:MAG: hypothetical protein JW751_10490 [Polyangiaceae bacterium]|nr:hypothetical protein [Polyangiaceae bacterium]